MRVPESIEEVWDSYEHLMKRKLEEIDYMTRQIFREMAFARSANNEKIRNYLHEQFALLWEQVAAEQEVKTKRRERE